MSLGTTLPRQPETATPPTRERTPHPSGSGLRLLIPREHGAWGMVSLPFLAGMLVAGDWLHWRTAAAALAVFAVFLLREPLLFFWRLSLAESKYQGRPSSQPLESRKLHEVKNARFSLWVYGIAAASSGIYLLTTLPLRPLLLLGGGAALLTMVALYFTAHNQQRAPALQIAVAAGLTSSCLLSYLAARGRWEEPVLWIWALSAAHSSASVLTVHARLEALLAARKPGAATGRARRNALLAQAGICLLFILLLAVRRPWFLLPFLPPTLLHWRELWQFRSGAVPHISMHRVGWTQLAASVAFFFLLIAVLR
ncbi:MAG: YwiC-like family protein [Acidobacteria bacterium]|nr:YwiC-like family protein [Acidobacteriota bacterium]